ncbi:hypothetical protein CN923_21545 [Bacillus cereus]|nr:hypothetical protein CON44_19695 [Bacillus cereus]PFK29183.1 hypothetical protein COJ05_02735 [Bacillus cereus]PFP62943.1 hypothetical protein COK09_01775 [Bacillus cereus]PFV25527.1 hypothetical protein COK97_01445 [Bacillus cereus]PGK84649.1 hypothetical protein CN924_05905 [Bacillus cereus]
MLHTRDVFHECCDFYYCVKCLFIIALSVFLFVVFAIIKMFIAIAFLIILSMNKRKYGDS